MSDSNKNTKHILTDTNNNNTDTHNGKMLQNGLDDNVTEQVSFSLVFVQDWYTNMWDIITVSFSLIIIEIRDLD